MSINRPPTRGNIATLDLNFRGRPGTIASYLIPHNHGAILIECGPGSTLPDLQTALEAYGFSVKDVTDVLVTHIHLDHAGAAGWLAHQGANIYVHSVGAPHMLDPGKLLASAERIYGDMMETLWGDFLPIPEERLQILNDGDVVEIDGLQFRALDTPGHANHHFAYLYQDTCFSGDIGGVRMRNMRHLRLPMPPPEFHIERWRESLQRLQNEYEGGAFTRIAPTHFGVFDDADWHLAAIGEALDAVEAWMEDAMPADPSIEELNQQFLAWAKERSLEQGVGAETIQVIETANPSWMAPYGIQRYWRKFRQ